MAMVMAACIGVLIGYTLLRAAPRWWRTILREDPATVNLAVNVENALINRVNEHKPLPPREPGQPWLSEPWTIRIDSSEANAWLNVRLPMWLNNQEERF